MNGIINRLKNGPVITPADAAIKLAELTGAVVVLGSATPDVGHILSRRSWVTITVISAGKSDADRRHPAAGGGRHRFKAGIDVR